MLISPRTYSNLPITKDWGFHNYEPESTSSFMHLVEPINQRYINFDVDYSWMAFSAAKAVHGLQMSVNLPICQSVCLSVCLSIYPSSCAFQFMTISDLCGFAKIRIISIIFMNIFFIILREDQWRIAIQSKFNQSIFLRAPTQWVIYLWYSYNFQLATNQILNSGCLSTRKNYSINLLLQFLNVKDISLSFM